MSEESVVAPALIIALLIIDRLARERRQNDK